MNNEAKESAVSEVVGVILMVALTVIMAAIIGAYMFGMMDGHGLTPHILAVTAQQASPSTLEVRYMGGPDYKSLENLTITWPSGARQLVDSPENRGCIQGNELWYSLECNAGRLRSYHRGRPFQYGCKPGSPRHKGLIFFKSACKPLAPCLFFRLLLVSKKDPEAFSEQDAWSRS